MNCKHERTGWRETSFTSGGWNVRIFCLDCGDHLGFSRLADVGVVS